MKSLSPCKEPETPTAVNVTNNFNWPGGSTWSSGYSSGASSGPTVGHDTWERGIGLRMCPPKQQTQLQALQAPLPAGPPPTHLLEPGHGTAEFGLKCTLTGLLFFPMGLLGPSRTAYRAL